MGLYDGVVSYEKDIIGKDLEEVFECIFGVGPYITRIDEFVDNTNYNELLGLIESHSEVPKLAVVGWLMQNLEIISLGVFHGIYSQYLRNKGLEFPEEENEEMNEHLCENYFIYLKEIVSNHPPFYYRAIIRGIISEDSDHHPMVKAFAGKLEAEAKAKEAKIAAEN